MNYLEQYYRNMCEQLQSRINLLEKQIDDPQITNPADLSQEEQRQQRVSIQVHNYAKRRGHSTSPVDYGSEGPQRNTRQTPGGTQYEVEPLGKETVKNVYTGDKFAISHSTQGVPDQEEIGPADEPSKDYEPVSTGEDAEAEYKRVQASKTKALKEHRNNNMNYLEQYYKNLCEQLQSQIDLLEKRFDISKFNKSKKSDKKDEKKDDKKSGKKADKKADKDYDGDGEVESSKDEYFGSKDKAIKKAIAEKKKKKTLKEGREISGNQFNYGGFPRILNEVKGPSSSDVLGDFLDNDPAGSAGGPIDPKIHAEISQHIKSLINKGSFDQAGAEHVEGLQAAYKLLGGKGAFAAHIEDTLERIGDQSHAKDVASDQNKMYFRGNM